MAQPQIRPGAFAGSARIAGAGTLINATGIITGITKTGTGQYTLTIDPGASPNEHNYTVTPILTGFNADASGTVDVSGASPVVQTSVGGVAADCDCYVEVKRVLTADGKVFSTPAAVPSGPPTPPSTGLSSIIYGRGGLQLFGNITTFLSIIGGTSNSALEPDIITEMPSSGKMKNLRLFVATNTLIVPFIVTLRKNNVSTILTTTVGAGLTGIFRDTINIVDYVATDLINWQFVAAVSSGNSIVATIQVENTTP